MIQDPELAKRLTIKNFEYFSDHQPFISPDYNPIFQYSLFLQSSDKWKTNRSVKSPMFTSNKLRLMFNSIVDVCEQTVTYLRAGKEENYDAGNIFLRVTADILGRCGFGIKSDSLKDMENDFFRHANEISQLGSPIWNIKIIAAALFPNLMRFLGIRLVPKNSIKFFKSLTHSTIEARQNSNEKYPDLLDVLTDMQKEGKALSGKTHLSETDIASESTIFLIIGLESTASILTFIAYELAKNPQVQDKLFEELNAHGKLDKLSYESLQHLKYLDMVVTEGMRLWPPFAYHDRVCTKDFTVDYDNGKTYTFKVGDAIWIPFSDYQLNPNYFNDPQKFDPDRFSPENKTSTHSSTYLPFGEGPRICPG